MPKNTKKLILIIIYGLNSEKLALIWRYCEQIINKTINTIIGHFVLSEDIN